MRSRAAHDMILGVERFPVRGGSDDLDRIMGYFVEKDGIVIYSVDHAA